MEPVLVTGLGVVCCLGSGPEAFWSGLAAASSAPRPARDPYAHMALPLFYEVADEDVPPLPATLEGTPLGRAPRLAVEATKQAMADAALADVPSSRLGVVIGTGMGDSGLHERWRVGGAPAGGRWTPAFLVASAVGDWLGPCTANVSISNACSAGGYALAVAADMIRCGDADVVVAGGADAYSRVALACFNRLGAVDPERCRPFDAHRRGTVFGEGAAVLILESESHARRRGARAEYGRLAGSGWSCDAHHPTAPEPDGRQIVRAMREALAAADSSPDEVGCVIPHGTGTELNDVVESRSLQELFGARCGDVPLYSLKALVGHTGGAAGALAVVTAALMLRHGTVPANAAPAEQDPECKVWVPREPVPIDHGRVLVNAYAFGGNNVSLVLERAA